MKIKELQSIFTYLDDTTMRQLDDIAVISSYKNKETIIDLSSNEKAVYFTLKGMVRGFSYESTGEERTVFIRPEHTFFAAPELLSDGKNTKYYFEAIQAVEVVSFALDIFMKMTEENILMARLYNDALKENMLTLIFRIELLASKSPEERYNLLIQRFPVFFEKAQHRHIANYLGMTPTSLSRIIKRRKEK